MLLPLGWFSLVSEAQRLDPAAHMTPTSGGMWAAC
jgi:hypothetical protein